MPTSATIRYPTCGNEVGAEEEPAMPQPAPRDPDIGPQADPAVWRGLTGQRVSRRGLLRAGGLAVGAATIAGGTGLAGLLAGCGDAAPAAAVTEAVGTTAWWSKQRLHHTVNFANWPDYIDVLHGKHPTLEHFTALTGISVNYTEPVSDNVGFFNSIKPSIERKQYTGYDIIVTTTNSPALGELISNNWLIPLNQSMMANFRKYGGRLAENPPWDPGNTYTMPWQSGWTAIGYNSAVVTTPGSSVGILFDSKYAGKVGMMSDPQELGSVGLLAIGVEPATSTEADWRKAATFLQKQKSAGIVRGYYNQNYIDNLKSGEIVVSQAYSGDIFQANLQQQYRDLQLLMPVEGGMFWTDNMCIPLYAENPKDAMTLMDYFYQPQVEAVVEYYNDYVCPVPGAQQELLNPTGWAAATLAAMRPEIGEPPSYTADSPLVFPTKQYQARSRTYYQFSDPAELALWNSLFEPIAST
jgi:spermidine/putrescine transport system substrate-binding protein